MTRTRPRHIALGLSLLMGVLAGCGFHLQGVARLPPAFSVTALASDDRYTDLHQSLADSLKVAGSRVVGRGEPAGAELEILSEDSGQRVLSVSATNSPTEYEVYYTVRYRVRIDGREVLAPQSLTLNKDYSFDEAAILAKEQEQQQIHAALARELAALIMRRLTAVAP